MLFRSMLRAMAKRPADRYRTGHELVAAFLAGLTEASAQPAFSSLPAEDKTSMRSFKTGSFFDPSWQTGTFPATASPSPAPVTGLLSAYKISKRTVPLPAASLLNHASTGAQPALPATLSSKLNDTLAPTPTGALPTSTGAQPALAPHATQNLPLLNTTTGALAVPNYEQGAGNTIKLTGPVKVVQVPIAGQPGRYLTGLLPVVAPPTPATETMSSPSNRMKLVALIAAIILVVSLGTGAFWLFRIYPTTLVQQGTSTTIAGTPDTQATAVAQATATADANIILSDPLSQNIHNWPSSPTATAIYAFTGNAYHITNLGDTGTAVVLQEKSFDGPIVYTLTMQEIKGDDTSLNNSFGMIIRSSEHNAGGKSVTTFYSFEVVNTAGGEYRFYKYDDSQGSSSSPWTEIWHQPFGSEFHLGHGPQSINTCKISANGSHFIFTVNGKKVGEIQDHTLAEGGVGMLVNLKGTEVAFSNLLISRS